MLVEGDGPVHIGKSGILIEDGLLPEVEVFIDASVHQESAYDNVTQAVVCNLNQVADPDDIICISSDQI